LPQVLIVGRNYGSGPKIENEVVLEMAANARFKRDTWRAQGDDFRTFFDDFVAAFSQIEFPRLNLFAPDVVARKPIGVALRLSGGLRWVS
jgi:hypothetical protein